MAKIIFFANTDWYLFNYRLPLAKALRGRGNEVVLLSPPGDYSRRLEAEGFRWREFAFSRRGLNPFIELDMLWRLWRIYRQEKPDVTHHFTIKCVIYGSFAARKAGVKKIINAIPGLGHVFIDNRLQGRILRWMVRQLYRAALIGTEVIFQNPDDRDLFLNAGLVKTQHQRLIKGSGVDMQQFALMGEPHGVPVIILPARMMWAKGVAEFIAASHLLKERGVAARFALVGDCLEGDPGAVPRQQLQAWKDEGVIEWWGWHDDMLEMYRQAHIVCLPSYYGEGVPRSLVEASACGRPVVATDMPGCREIVQDGENGFLIPPRTARALAEALRRLVVDPGLRRRMGVRGREIAEEGFSLQDVLEKTLVLYG